MTPLTPTSQTLPENCWKGEIIGRWTTGEVVVTGFARLYFRERTESGYVLEPNKRTLCTAFNMLWGSIQVYGFNNYMNGYSCGHEKKWLITRFLTHFRWSILQLKVGRFIGCFATIGCLKPSGTAFEDRVRDPMALYKEQHGEEFLFFIVFEKRSFTVFLHGISAKQEKKQRGC